MNLPYCGHRFGGRPEPVERDVKTELLEPDTEEEYLELKADAGRAREVHWALLSLESNLRNMSEASRDEVEAHTGVRLLDLQETALPGIVKARHQQEAGIQAWERNYD